MKKTLSKIVALLLVLCTFMCLVACGDGGNNVGDAGYYAGLLLPEETKDDLKVEKDDNGNVFITAKNDEIAENDSTLDDNIVLNNSPKGEFNEGVVLVKAKENFNKADLGDLKYTSAEALYNGSKWYTVKLDSATTTEDAVNYLTDLGTFDKVDYDYIMGTTGPKEEAEGNPNFDKQVNLGLSNIPHGWTVNGKAPGGTPDVVVAVIDTGVDYNHLDLRNNIWVNTAEIPNNGKDDDSNGYVDDIYGWNCVGDNNNPMDDNGHGTHVAGIIAAENNKEGGIGVAYNCKVMVLKAGNSSGYFNNSDIAEAVQYAYMNGASVINMSFGGSNISLAVEEALENAYNTSVLVAAAGNDGACNNLACRECDKVGVSYPAALPYVIGVMSTDKDGKHLSSFSNYDHNPYDSIEYEVYAVGEGVGSTWPSNKYTCLNGTSMAAPTVAGIAALLRSYYSDREVYSTKFIQSQIVNTGTVNPHRIVDGKHVTDGAHSVADVVEALTKVPTPEVNLYGYTIDDSVSISKNNNGNGVVDAGETIRLYISLHNRGGVASNVNVSIDTYRSEVGDETMTDPYFTLVNKEIVLSDIGTYSVRESGDKYFEIVVSADCPNDYLVDFNIRFTYTNGMDEKDNTNYSGGGVAQFNVSRGYLLPAIITENTVYKADRLYIVGEDVVIPEGVTVTFEEGCEIQFYDDREYYNSPEIIVYGTLLINGTKEKMTFIFPSERYNDYVCRIYAAGSSTIKINYLSVQQPYFYTSSSATITLQNSYCASQSRAYNIHQAYKRTTYPIYLASGVSVDSCAFSSYHTLGNLEPHIYVNTMMNSFIVTSALDFTAKNDVTNNIFLTQKNDRTYLDIYFGFYGAVDNNLFEALQKDVTALPKINRYDESYISSSNIFSAFYQQYISQVINKYYDSTGTPTVDVYGSLADASLLWPHVVSVEMFDKDGNPITTIGKEEIKVRVTFNRPMDVNAGTFLTFGTIEPYADYRIDGEWISNTVWEGTYTLKAQIENGQNFLKVNNAWAAEDPTKKVFGEYHLHEFTIDTTAAMSMNLQAFPKAEGIELNFVQDDYDTLLGYNIYRSTEKDGNYVKLNPTILLPEENAFLDENAEPGKTYWYTYTVVLSDFTESKPAGKVQATAYDTMSPSLYHTPVNQGYENNNLVISCTATDNVAISKVTLYYRTTGTSEWKSLVMAKQNDKFNATIFGSDVTLAGIEYYIVATDGNNEVNKGSADVPYSVLVKSADALLGLGDVDGNGTITTKDALMIMQSINGDLVLTDDQFKRANLNGDTILSSVEALRILKYINGNVTSLEM